MKRVFAISSIAIVVIAGCLLTSCKQTRELTPSTDFAPFISAYTGGMVSSTSSVRVQMTEEQPEDVWRKEISGSLFTFTPSLKGTAHWLDGNTVEFIPEEGELKQGTMYNVTFALNKVMKVDKKFAKFEFSFRVEERTFSVTTRPLNIASDNTVTVYGDMKFSEAMTVDEVKKMVSAKFDKNDVEVKVEGSDNAREFVFLVQGLKRKDDTQQLLVTIDGASAKIDNRQTLSVTIPAQEKFQLYDYEIVNEPEYGLQLTFSDVVSDAQDLKSMITLKGRRDYTVQVKANQVMVYFTPTSEMTELEVTIYPGLKNHEGKKFDYTKELVLSIEPMKPKVEILSSGTIMPGSEKLILPFRTVALRAVDVKIIRIFENNVLMFLQDNMISETGSNQLRRAGRLILKKTLRLNTDPTKKLTQWENNSLDLTGLINQQPGAIYRIEMSFNQSYASYACDDDDENENTIAGTTDLTIINQDEGELSEADQRYWDSPDAYYYEGYDMNINWNKYEWSERDNPCHPTYYMQTDRKAITHVLSSNLGMIAKSNSENKIWIAVTDLLDTKPVNGAKVTAYNYQLQPLGSVQTDENGFALMALKNKPFILVAASGEQKSYLRMQDGQENMLSRFDVGGVSLKKGLKGFIYGERGVWRPGDTLHIAFMIEDREKKIPDNHPVSLEIYNPRGQFYKKMISTTGLNGLHTFDVPTSADDPTGLWNTYIKVGGATFHKGLRIETVKPNRLKINLELPDVMRGTAKTIPVGIKSQWLTGAIARGLSAKMEIVLNRISTQFKGYENYVFNNPATSFSSSKNEVFDGKLNDVGEGTFDMVVPSAEQAPGLLNATITCRVFEPGGDASIFSQAVPFSPFSSYVGINFNRKKDQYYLFTDEDQLFDVATLDYNGKPVSRDNIEYKIYRIGWSWWWERQDESFESFINNSSYSPVFSGKIKTTNGKGQIKFRVNYPDWGRYLVFVKDTESGHATGGAVLVDWPSWRGRSNKSDPSGIKMLTFSMDKESYEVGEEVVVTIPATASEGRALLALENGTEVLQREWVTLTAGTDTKYSMKATANMAPNVYIHISLLLPHASTTDLPIRMYGVMPLFVTNKASVLTPLITVADVLKPETDFEVKVKEQNDMPMTYTLAIVDDGLLDLTNFKTPNPWSEFYAREALGIRTWDMFDDVMGAYAGRYGSLFSIGGDGDADNAASKANRFKPVVLFVGPVALKAGETKTHSLRLPPYVGSVRVMVVAGQNSAYGRADKTVAVRAPLMLLSSLPRVLSTGEKISLPVNVFAMEDNVKKVTVKVETTGKLKAVGKAQQDMTFSAPGDDILYFPMETGAETGIETVTITATGSGQTSKETIEIDIRNPNPPMLFYESKLLEKGQSVELDYQLEETYEGNWVKVEMSRIPSVDISRRFDYLYDYNHFCTEQLTSRALPLLFLSEFKDLDTKETEQTKKNITEAINNLYRRQLANGGFAYWAGQGYVNDWASSYAGSFLALAKERGYSVNGSVLTKWIGYQRTMALNWRQNESGSDRYAYDQFDLMQAYRLYTLALAGAPELGAMNRMKEMKGLSIQAKWRLAAAYAISGKQDAAGELVFNASTTVNPYSSNNPSYGSSYRDEAMILETLTLMNRNEEAFKQAQIVSKNLSSEKYFCTQSTAYAMVAMGQFARKMSGKLDFEWFLNGTKQKKVDTKKAVFETGLPTKPSVGKVKVQNGNEGVIYVGLSTKTRPVIDNLPAISENLKLEVTYTDMVGNPIKETELAQGTDFYAIVKVSNISGTNRYTDIALTHIIPSGWEIYNERMVAASVSDDDNSKSSSNVFIYQDIRDDRVLTYFDLRPGTTKEIKVRLQASYIGEFVFPAIQCEAMYDASARARTPAARVTVYK